MSDIEWTNQTPTFTDPIEWWRLRQNMQEQPFVVAVETLKDGGNGILLPGLAAIVRLEDLPIDVLWGGRVCMGEPCTP